MKDLSGQAAVCYVALGSNLGDSQAYLKNALDALQAHQQITNLKTSKYYQSKPHGPQDQPDYLNAAVRFETTLDPEILLNYLQEIENKNERIREGVARWGARTLDLDLLFYADMAINSKRLSVPHPRICERAFVLLPLRDLGADLKIDTNTSIKDCIDKLPSQALKDIKEISND